MPAEKNKCGDIPAHDENADGNAYNGSADGIHITHVFRGQVEGVCTKALHECTIHGTEENKPEDQQYLELLEVKQEQLQRK